MTAELLRALFPLTARLAARLAEAFPDFPRRFSYCGGVSAFNHRRSDFKFGPADDLVLGDFA